MECHIVSHIIAACLISAPGIIFFGAVLCKAIRDRLARFAR